MGAYAGVKSVTVGFNLWWVENPPYVVYDAVTALGEIFATAAAIAPICPGVVPQQPPTIFTSPLCANSFKNPEVVAGVSS